VLGDGTSPAEAFCEGDDVEADIDADGDMDVDGSLFAFGADVDKTDKLVLICMLSSEKAAVREIENGPNVFPSSVFKEDGA